MKVALLLPGSIWYAPYVRIYTNILRQNGVCFDIISWNREGDDRPEGFQYNVPCAKGHGSAGWKAYQGYIKFIKKTIKEQGFDKLIVFGPQMTCMLSTYLLRHFRGRYMIDYRDLSIEQKIGFRQLFAIMLKHSCLNVISSPGFKRCLPKRDYQISHNFNVEAVEKALTKSCEKEFHFAGEVVDVLTIGGIRDYSSNIEVVKNLANKDGFRLRFVGKGGAATQIEKYCKENGIINIHFHGFYQKQEEPEFIRESTFMNIFYPRKISHDTAMSNRFYNSLIYRRPMIVTKDTTQGDFAEKYKLGVSVTDCSNLDLQLKGFLGTNFEEYVQRCNKLLKVFLEDEKKFRKSVEKFIE